MSLSVDALAKNVKEFCDKLESCSNDRYLSWEHCYEAFNQERNCPHPNLEKLCLHLAFYLASWGMYRGSSFLLQRDYRIHREPIQILLDKKYDALWGIDAERLSQDVKLVFDLSDRLAKYYQVVRQKVCDDAHKDAPKIGVSQTLITKILMGTMGCCPAYDRYFVDGIGEGVPGYKFCKTFSKKSLAELSEFYIENCSALKCVNRKTLEHELAYPQMKILDMVFWKKGFDKEDRS